MPRKKKVQLQPKSKLGLNDQIKICFNCMFYQKDGFCPWENEYKNYNDKCMIHLKHWPHTSFRYRLDLPYKLLDPTKK